MAIKIQCPECQHEMSLKTFKAGRFKPTCARCKSAFQLAIGPGESPEIKIAKLGTPATTAKELAEAKPSPAAADTLPVTKSDAPVGATIAQPEPVVDGSSTNAARSNEQTLEHISGAVSSNRPVAQSAATSVEQTMEQPKRPVDAEATVALGHSGPSVVTAPVASLATKQASPVRQEGPSGAVQHGARSMPLPERLGGYRILKELGRGGMGAVYLARQLSLDRNVAVKTIQNDWSANPRAVARFIREAYAAAQLTHHNVVQIYDLGQESSINFFSMELVEGGSLDDLIKRQGRLPPKQAATYILHAARGLRFAHEHGMIHRDIKPANLLLTNDSLVKVADLGLVKTPTQSDDEQTTGDDSNLLLASARSEVTGAGSTLGTPAYMAPEQAEDATTVDHRADIYSLGCTFYALLVGKPPYGNLSAVEILSKIKTERIARVDSVIQEVPAEIAKIVETMTDKSPDARYQSINGVIEDLERYLGTGSTSPLQRADGLRTLADKRYQLPTSRLKRWLPAGVAALLGSGLLIGLLFNWRFSLFCAMCLAFTPAFLMLFHVIIGQRSPIAQRVRALILQSSIGDWVVWGVGTVALVTLEWLFGLTAWAIAALVVSASLAAAESFGIATLHRKQSQPITDEAKEIVRQMRLQGVEESQIAAFVREFAGKHWEGLLESLFGYESMRSQRQAAVQAGQHKGQWIPSWRDLVVDRLDAKLASQRDAREQRVLEKVEAAGLQAAGIDKKRAEEQASALASSLVNAASQARLLNEQALGNGKVDAAAKRDRIKQMLTTARSGKPPSNLAKASRATGQLVNQLFGGKLRFTIGMLLLIGCGLWANQNNLFDKDKLAKVGDTLQASAKDLGKPPADLEAGQAMASKVGQQVTQVIGQTKPLVFPVVGPYFTSFAPGLMGLLILLSALVGTWRLTIPAVIAAALTLLSPQLGLPSFSLPGGAEWIGCAAGMVALMLPVVIKPLR